MINLYETRMQAPTSQPICEGYLTSPAKILGDFKIQVDYSSALASQFRQLTSKD